MLADVGRYDSYDHTKQMQFAMEFNSMEGDPTPTMYSALSDAAFLMGAQRNSQLVTMAAFAPLFINVYPGASMHHADLIGYNALSSFASVSYYAQKMIKENGGTVTLPVTLKAPLLDYEPPLPCGGIGLGTWGVDAEYKDIQVTSGDGKVLYAGDFSKGTEGWDFVKGDWKGENSTLRQASNTHGCVALHANSTWADYTLSLKARKNAGAEGFLILVHASDIGNYTWLNLGAWNNSRATIEQTLDGGKTELASSASAAGRIATGQWYDIRIDVSGSTINCYVDGMPVINATERPRGMPPVTLIAEAARDEASGEVIVKVVNVLPVPQQLKLKLDGLASVEPEGTMEVISGKAGDVNSIDHPEAVIPKRSTINVAAAKSGEWTQEFLPYSLTVLRVKGK